jgi:hypothetical protein
MTNESTQEKAEKTNLTPAEISQVNEIHKEAANHHEAAAKHHRDAVIHLEAGDNEHALESVIKAQMHQAKATEYHSEALRFHRVKG